MKDESFEDVQEFIRYHRWIGVDRFFLRENGNTSAIAAGLQPYIDAGIVDFGYLDGPKHPTQTNWFNSCSKMASRTYSWVAFIDLDEFIIVLNKQQAVTERDALKMVLRKSFRYVASVSMQWILFGSGGHKERPPEGQLKGFNRCSGTLAKQMKCLGSSFWFHYRATFRPTHVHQCTFRYGGVAVLGSNEPLIMWRVPLEPGAPESPIGTSNSGHLPESEAEKFKDVTDDTQIVLFHYVTRAQNDFMQRKINLRSGVYATEFKNITLSLSGESGSSGVLDPQSMSEAALDEMYARFEHEKGFDGDFPICHQGAALTDAINDAVAKGWTEFDT